MYSSATLYGTLSTQASGLSVCLEIRRVMDDNMSGDQPGTMPPTSDDAILDQDILKIFGVDTLPETEKNDLYRHLFAVLENRALIAIDNSLGSEDLEAWKQVIDEGDISKMDEFLKSKGIDFKKLLLSEAVRLKLELADLAKASYQASTSNNDLSDK